MRKVYYVHLAIGSRGWTIVRTKLDGVEYQIRVDWNPGDQFWSLTIYDVSGVELRGGLALRHAVDVLEPFPGAEMPGAGAGQLGAWDFTRRQQDPGRDDLRSDSGVRLVYVSIEETS